MRTMEQGLVKQGLWDPYAGNLVRGSDLSKKLIGWHGMRYGQGFCLGTCSVVAHVVGW